MNSPCIWSRKGCKNCLNLQQSSVADWTQTMLLSLFLLLRIWIFCRDSWASPTEAEKLRTLDSSGGDDQKRGGYSDVFLLRDIVISFLLAGRDTSSSGKKTFRELSWGEKTVRNLILHLFLFSSCRNFLVTKKKFC